MNTILKVWGDIVSIVAIDCFKINCYEIDFEIGRTLCCECSAVGELETVNFNEKASSLDECSVTLTPIEFSCKWLLFRK